MILFLYKVNVIYIFKVHKIITFLKQYITNVHQGPLPPPTRYRKVLPLSPPPPIWVKLTY